MMLDWLANAFNKFIDFLYALLLTLFDMLKDLLFWIFEQIFTVALFLLDGLGSLIEGLNVAQYFSALPPETIYLLSISGFGEAMGMITTCLVIRFLIQMIPLVRWGS